MNKSAAVSSRYASIDSSPSPSSSSAASKQPQQRLLNPMPPTTGSSRDSRSNSSRALVRARSDRDLQTHNLGSMLKRFISMDKKKNKSNINPPPPPIIPTTAHHNNKDNANKLSALSRKLLGGQAAAAGGGDRKALAEVKSNTRTLAMVLRSERELLAQNKGYEDDIAHLRLLLQQKDREVEKLKDLCLRQREEIKALKDAVLFPDVMNSTTLQELVEEQGSELQQAKRLIPTLQKQLSSLTGQMQCLAHDLAEVKADKLTARTFFDEYTSSPRTPVLNQETAYSLECSIGEVETPNYGSPDEMFIKDLNPCLTPCISKSKSEVYDKVFGCETLMRDKPFQCSSKIKQDISYNSCGRLISKSSEHHKPTSGTNSTQRIYKSDEDKIYQNLF